MVRKIILSGLLLLAMPVQAHEVELVFYNAQTKSMTTVTFEKKKLTIERNANLYIAPHIDDLGVLETTLTTEQVTRVQKFWHILSRIEEKYAQSFHASDQKNQSREKIKVGKVDLNPFHREYSLIHRELNLILKEFKFHIVEGYKIDPVKNSYRKISKDTSSNTQNELCHQKEEEVCVIDKVFFYHRNKMAPPK